MSYGLQISASGVMTSLYAQDVYANNLANIDTPGFKADLPTLRARQAVREEDKLPFLPSNKLLERLGGGAALSPNRISFAQGSLKSTGGQFDLAIEGDGFFVVKDNQDKSGAVRLTRDGRFTRDRAGKLVNLNGQPVLDENDRPIQLPPGGSVSISGDGRVMQNGREVAQIQLASVKDPSTLTKVGASQFSADPKAVSGQAKGVIHQGQIEDSAADEIKTLMQMTSAGRDVDSNVSMIQQYDRMMDRAINGLGRVA